MRFLTCEPNLNKSVQFYEDEADKFYARPVEWFDENYSPIQQFTKIVLFENLHSTLSSLKNDRIDLFLSKFHKCSSFFHSFIKQSSRIDNNLLLFCLNNSSYNENNKDHNDSSRFKKDL